MRFSTGLTLAALLAALLAAAPIPASAQGTPDATVKAIDKAGETAATRGAPGTVVPDSPGVAVAPGIQAPVETPVRPSDPHKDAPPAAK